MPLIHAENISMTYGAPPRTVLDRIDLEIEEGEFVCVLGQTGCGKSTLLRLILGCEHPTRGRILIDGQEHKQPDRARGYVPQKYSLFPDKTVLDNITTGDGSPFEEGAEQLVVSLDEAFAMMDRPPPTEGGTERYIADAKTELCLHRLRAILKGRAP